MKLKYLFLSLALLAGCTSNEESNEEQIESGNPVSQVETQTEKEITSEPKVEKESGVEKESEVDKESSSENESKKASSDSGVAQTSNHKLIEVDGGDTSGYRQANVVVDIGFGDREYWAYTNEHGQLVRVTAKEIILQNDSTEPVKDGRYYSKMADVPGVGAKNGYDRGHIIADSLGGVANAYNITPQEATLNRHGDQAYMERNIREAGGATNFEAIITYPNTETQTPSKYKFTYTIKGNKVVDEFENANPDKKNNELGLTGKPKGESSNEPAKPKKETSSDSQGTPNNGDLASVDTNGNGKVTIKEAKDAGFKMPITKEHWLYQYMDDRDGDGVVGE